MGRGSKTLHTFLLSLFILNHNTNLTLHITYCANNQKKLKQSRYKSNKIKEIRSIANKNDDEFAILSGKYGLIPPEKPIPEYDKLLEKEDIENLLPQVRRYLQSKNTEKVIYHTKELVGKRIPYFTLMKETCVEENIDFEK